ncbi:MAG: FCD domain-containing protein [Acidimicrobiia bacterium]
MAEKSEIDGLFESFVFAPVETQTVFEATLARLTTAIKLGLLAPGTRLPSEADLAVRLGISRATLREAIRSLQQSSLLESRRGRTGGSYILETRRQATRDEALRLSGQLGQRLFECLDLRAVLEPASAEFAARRSDEFSKGVLRTLLEHSHQAPSSFRRADARLHVAIGLMSGVPALAVSIAQVQADLDELIALIPTFDVSVRRSHQQHESIIDAICDGDAVAARSLVQTHVDAMTTLINNFVVGEEAETAGGTPVTLPS